MFSFFFDFRGITQNFIMLLNKSWICQTKLKTTALDSVFIILLNSTYVLFGVWEFEWFKFEFCKSIIRNFSFRSLTCISSLITWFMFKYWFNWLKYYLIWTLCCWAKNSLVIFHTIIWHLFLSVLQKWILILYCIHLS